MKKILIYTSGSMSDTSGRITGGAKRFCCLARYLFDHNLADICSMDTEEEQNKTGLSNVWHLSPARKNFKIPFPPEMKIALTNKKILKQIKESKYDKIIIFDVPPAVCLTFFGIRNLVLMLRKDAVEYEKTNSKRNFSLKIFYIWLSEILCILHSKQIIVQCEYDKKNFKHRHPLLSGRIERITDIQINNVNPPWVSNQIIAKKDSEHFRVCFIGGFSDPRKGQDLMLSAACLAHQKDSDLNFEIIGGGQELEEYKDKYNYSWINFYGHMNNPLSILATCDLLVVPSLSDSCPNTVSEGLNLGVPVIGSNRGGIPELIKDEQALFSIDADELANLIVRCKQDCIFYLSIKDKQLKRKEELTFNWEEKISQLII